MTPNLQGDPTDPPLIKNLIRLASKTEDPFDQADIVDAVNLLRIRAAHIDSLQKRLSESLDKS